MEELHSIYPHLCSGHQIWFRRTLEALTAHDFFNEISFVFKLREKTVEEDQSMVHLSSEQKLKTIVQQTRDRLAEPGISAMLMKQFKIVHGLDLAQSITFEMMKRDFRTRCLDQRLLSLFESEIIKSLRGL
jgi:hypothetical protein